jgi:release factor glutamine methyltransferase
LGEAYFHGLKLHVDSSVLIPRPETEELVAWVIADVKTSGAAVCHKGAAKADQTRTLRILDVGTGSGCIALALKKTLPKAEVWGCDTSDAALNIARRNAAELDIRVDFQGVNFLDTAQWAGLPLIDILVSNPPYIAQSEQHTLAPNVVQHEPHAALFVPDANPLVFYEALSRFGAQKLHAGGAIYAEIHEAQGKAVVQLFKNAMYADVQLRKDMQGKDRLIKAVVRSN